MTPERWQAVKRIFAAASEQPEDERRRYVDEACADDADLAREVQSLLAASAAERVVVDEPAAASLAEDAFDGGAERWLGRRVGAYEIVAQIGRGGMGDVFRARRVDAQYDKQVAIKLVSGGFQTDHVLQRLRVERQILAGLEHPNIARLIDGGATDEGSPYLVMELVEGEPLDEYCQRRALEMRERLRLFRDVCAAVSYAHRHLVVHRDLKPSNILVTPDGVVKLLDFGIAKLLHQAGGISATVTMMPAMTFGYSSPEQVLGKPITTTSDVYSLGVVLYKLLTDRSPYRTELESTADAIREVCETEPRRPSVAVQGSPLAGRLDRDLDAIVLRSLRKEPEQRYGSVEQLSDDVQRYLESLPVRARGDELGYRARRFMRRHKLELGAAALIAAALITGTVVSVREANNATRQEQLTEAQRERAERHFASVRKLADVFMFDVNDAIANLPGSTAARELLVKTALEYLNTLAAEAGEDLELRREVAAAYIKVGEIQGEVFSASTGDAAAALESYGKALSLLASILKNDPQDVEARVALGAVESARSSLLLPLGKIADAAAAGAHAVALLEGVGKTKKTAVALASAYSRHAEVLDYAGDSTAAIESMRKAIGLMEDLVREQPDDLDLLAGLSAAYGNAGALLPGPEPDPAILTEAIALQRKALEIDERLVVAGQGTNTLYLRSAFTDHLNLANYLKAMGRYDEALEHAIAGRTLSARLLTDDKDASVQLLETIIAWHLGEALLGLDRVDEAAVVLERNRTLLRTLLRGQDNLRAEYQLAATTMCLGKVHAQRAARATGAKRLAEWRLAKSAYESALPHFTRVTDAVTLDHVDRMPIESAVAGLAKSTAEIERLAVAQTGRP